MSSCWLSSGCLPRVRGGGGGVRAPAAAGSRRGRGPRAGPRSVRGRAARSGCQRRRSGSAPAAQFLSPSWAETGRTRCTGTVPIRAINGTSRSFTMLSSGPQGPFGEQKSLKPSTLRTSFLKSFQHKEGNSKAFSDTLFKNVTLSCPTSGMLPHTACHWLTQS